MEELAVNGEAQQALVRFLAKLKLIDRSSAEKEHSFKEECPIAYFSKKGLFDEEQVVSQLAKQLDIRCCRIDKTNAAKIGKLFEQPLLSRVDISRWIALRAIPIEVADEYVVVAMANPLDYDARSTLEFDIGRSVRVAISTEFEILALLSSRRRKGSSFSIDAILSENEELSAQTAERDSGSDESNLVRSDLDAAPIVRLVNKILADAVHYGASDVHITPEKDCVAVKVRVDGIMRKLFTVPIGVKNSVISRIKLLGGMDISERRKPQDGRLRIKTGLGVKDLRISTVPTPYGENVVARVLSSEVKRVSFKALGMPLQVIEQFKRALIGSSRVILACGPTGSGKTSTLYSVLLHLRDGKSNIITVEDPIEYRVSGITQIQVNPKVGMTFAGGLRSILRQDPDIIMVGEIRDGETAGISMQAAQTGHLVLSTIHTNTAPAAITRLVDLGIAPYLIASSVGSVVAQRLVRTLCTNCASAIEAPLLKRAEGLGLDCGALKQARGCDECDNTGFKGRRGIYSFLEVTDAVREAIREQLGEEEIARRAAPAGYRTLEQDGMVLLNKGLTSLDELERVLGPLDRAIENNSVSAAQPALKLSEAPPSQEANTPSKGNGLKKKKVLLVEDDENIRLIIATLLEREMFEVVEAANGYEALEKVYQEIPELILCDLMMPRMDGRELVERLRRDARTAAIPFLILTAADSEENEVKLIGSGVDDFVSKTANSEVLVARVHRLLARSGS